MILESFVLRWNQGSISVQDCPVIAVCNTQAAWAVDNSISQFLFEISNYINA